MFEVTGYGGWTRYPIHRLSLFEDGTLVAASLDARRCASLSKAEADQLRTLVERVATAGLGKPVFCEDCRNIGLKFGAFNAMARYEYNVSDLTPEGAAFIRKLDVIAQNRFGRFYGHTFVREGRSR
jgi:hypothetical protein